MKARKLLSGVLAGVFCLSFLSYLPVQAEDYWPSGPEVQSGAAVVMEVSTGTVLYEKNSHEQLYPASITKIMTTMLALENCSLDEEVTFSHDAVYSIDHDSSNIYRDEGEILTMEQSLYAVMLASANDCAYAVAEHAGKGYENFISMMNDKAAQLGCTDTHFNNPHGLPDTDHYTSAYDMALISRAAMQNDIFRLITGTKKYTIPVTNKHPNEETHFVNHHKMLTNYQGDTTYLYDHCIGGKTGYTDSARNTLVTFAEKDGMILVCVIMKSDPVSQYKDTRSLLDYCYDNFTMWNVSENASAYQVDGIANTEMFGNTGSFVDLDREGRIVLPKTAAFGDAACEIIEKPEDTAVVAVMEYTYADRVVGSVNIQRTNTRIESYTFGSMSESQEEEKTVLKIKVEYIIIGVAVLVALALLGLLIFYLANNFYIIRHKIRSRKKEKSKFKTIKSGKHTKWHTRW